MLPLINGATIKFGCESEYVCILRSHSPARRINSPSRSLSFCHAQSLAHAHTKADTDRRASVVVLDWNCQRCHIKCAIIKSRLNFMALQDRKLVGQSLKLRIHRAMCSIRPHFSPAAVLSPSRSPPPFQRVHIRELDLDSVALVGWMA